ncbi:MAG: hypothetical protein ACT452_21565 [Microthrixaceae bacterium]
MNEPRRQTGGGKSRRRKSGGNGGNKPRVVDLWQPVPALPDPEPIAPATDPRMLLRSLGDPPLAGQGAVAEHYIGAVLDRAAGLATALAAAAGLLAEPSED